VANNLFISYDLHKQGQDYEAIGNAIKQLGAWAKVHLSLYYVSTDLTPDQAYARVAASCDANDKVIVIHASGANWSPLPAAVSQQMLDHWNR